MAELPALFYSSPVKFLYLKMDTQIFSVMLIFYLSIHKNHNCRGNSMLFQMCG